MTAYEVSRTRFSFSAQGLNLSRFPKNIFCQSDGSVDKQFMVQPLVYVDNYCLYKYVATLGLFSMHEWLYAM